LEAIETASLRSLDFGHEALCEVFEHNTVGGGKESENVLNEVLLVLIELFPILDVLGEVNFLSGPESSLLVLVHLPDVAVLDGEEDKAVGVLFKERFFKRALSL
jgi:hypothetical protein